MTSESSRPVPRCKRSHATRALILYTAVECLVAYGYERTATVRVQARAGVSLGRLLHQFSLFTSMRCAAFTYALRVRDHASDPHLPL